MSQPPHLHPILGVLILVTAMVAMGACGAGADGSDAPPDEEGLAPPEAVEPEQDGQASPPADGPGDDPPPPEPEEPPTVPVDCTQVRVVDTGGVTLNVRPDPSTDHPAVGALDPGDVVDVLDVVADGEGVNGTTTWYEIDAGPLTGFVSAAFTACIDPNAPAPAFPADQFLLPLTCGSHVKVTQGNNTDFSHNGGSRYAFDFGIPLNTPMLAMKAGTVVSVRFITHPGDPCYSGGGESCINDANTVTIDHGDGSNTLYAHVNSIDVTQGQHVERGDVVAHSGSTGYSTGPHAHVQRQGDCGSWWCQSIQMTFADFEEDDHLPESGDWVTSQNGCP